VRPFAQEVGADPGRLRIGWLAAAHQGDTAPECREAARSAAELLASLGHEVGEESPPALADPQTGRGFLTVVTCSVAQALDACGEKIGRPLVADDVEEITWSVAEMGRGIPAPEYLAAVARNQARSREILGWWASGFDLLVTPTCAAPPPPLGHFAAPAGRAMEGFVRALPFTAFTSVFNLTGQPAISLPLFWSESGLPIGVQLVAATGREDLLLRVAAQLEAERPWRDRRPPVFAD
jgi:amidase